MSRSYSPLCEFGFLAWSQTTSVAKRVRSYSETGRFARPPPPFPPPPPLTPLPNHKKKAQISIPAADPSEGKKANKKMQKSKSKKQKTTTNKQQQQKSSATKPSTTTKKQNPRLGLLEALQAHGHQTPGQRAGPPVLQLQVPVLHERLQLLADIGP